MVDDIKLIFFPPQGVVQQKGIFPTDQVACRWQEKTGDFIDVITNESGITEIKKYSACGSLQRFVKLTQTAGRAYSSIELRGSGMLSYTLLMTLIDARPAETELPEKEKLKVKNNEKLRRR